MAITRGASGAQPRVSSDSTTSPSLTTATSSSLMVVGAVWENGSAAPTISDSKSNAYTLIGAVRRVSATFNAFCALWYCENAIGGNAHTVTAAKTGGNTSLFVAEYLDIATSGSLDQNTAVADDTSSPATSGSITTTTADQLLIGMIGVEGTADVAYTPNNSFTSVAQLTSFSDWQGILVERIVSSTGSYEASVGVTNLASSAAIIASFKAAGVPPPPPTYLLRASGGGVLLAPGGLPLKI